MTHLKPPCKASLLLALLLATVCGSVAARDFWQRESSGILSPDRAFALMPPEWRGDVLHVEWSIAPGYYLYRNRIRIEAAAPETTRLGALQLPAGEKIHDEHFGDVEIYRPGVLAAEVSAQRPVRRLKISYQGCADQGICLPPQTRIVDVLEMP